MDDFLILTPMLPPTPMPGRLSASSCKLAMMLEWVVLVGRVLEEVVGGAGVARGSVFVVVAVLKVVRGRIEEQWTRFFHLLSWFVRCASGEVKEGRTKGRKGRKGLLSPFSSFSVFPPRGIEE